jgi:hypothetical protein
MKKILLLSLIYILSGCCCGGSDCPPEESAPLFKKIDSEEFSWISAQLGVKWRKEFFLDLEDSNVYYGNNVHTLRYEFTTMSIFDIKQARELLVDVVEDILDAVNRNPIVSSELQSYPFTPENLEIYIDFLSFYNIYVDPFKVGFITLENGQAKYWAADVKDNRNYSWHARIEPYFRSRETVQLGRAAEEIYDEDHPKNQFQAVKELFRPQKSYQLK